jgi:hypothetical protein
VVKAVAYAPMVGATVDLDHLREEQEREASRQLDRFVATVGKRIGRKHVLLRVGAADCPVLIVPPRRSR